MSVRDLTQRLAGLQQDASFDWNSVRRQVVDEYPTASLAEREELFKRAVEKSTTSC